MAADISNELGIPRDNIHVVDADNFSEETIDEYIKIILHNAESFKSNISKDNLTLIEKIDRVGHYLSTINIMAKFNLPVLMTAYKKLIEKQAEDN